MIDPIDATQSALTIQMEEDGSTSEPEHSEDFGDHKNVFECHVNSVTDLEEQLCDIYGREFDGQEESDEDPSEGAIIEEEDDDDNEEDENEGDNDGDDSDSQEDDKYSDWGEFDGQEESDEDPSEGEIIEEEDDDDDEEDENEGDNDGDDSDSQKDDKYSDWGDYQGPWYNNNDYESEYYSPVHQSSLYMGGDDSTSESENEKFGDPTQVHMVERDSALEIEEKLYEVHSNTLRMQERVEETDNMLDEVTIGDHYYHEELNDLEEIGSDDTFTEAVDAIFQ
ncbi:FK506-binding protein 3-like [Macadamia integrifolia]|uniref:FK506-binding protein 3-like n=1 Tax=Macadamia integrifolia TaxID=60698 RepID=UPI001C4FB75D|nr:FK506-binding protein 3-like [Macadamia integrifolia]